MFTTPAVLGAVGGTGRALTAELAHRGYPVRAVTRTGESPLDHLGVHTASADVTDAAALTAALDGCDVVFHAAQPDYTHWSEEFPAMNRAITTAVAVVGARLVFADNLYSYGPGSSPMNERTPSRATDRKGMLRTRLAQDLLDLHRRGTLEVAIGRSSDYYGPGGLGTSLGMPVLQPLLTGAGPVPWLGSLHIPHTMHFLPDIADALVDLAGAPAAYGAIWHLPSAPAITGRQFLDLAAASAGIDYTTELLDLDEVTAMGRQVPMMAELAEIYYQWSEPFVSDSSAYGRAFGPVTVTPHEVAVPQTVAFFQQVLGLTGAGGP